MLPLHVIKHNGGSYTTKCDPSSMAKWTEHHLIKSSRLVKISPAVYSYSSETNRAAHALHFSRDAPPGAQHFDFTQPENLHICSCSVHIQTWSLYNGMWIGQGLRIPPAASFRLAVRSHKGVHNARSGCLLPSSLWQYIKYVKSFGPTSL